MGLRGNTCAVSMKAFSLNIRRTAQTVSKHVRRKMFRFDTWSSCDQGFRARAKTLSNECFDMDERQVLVYIRSVQDRFQSDGVKRSL